MTGSSSSQQTDKTIETTEIRSHSPATAEPESNEQVDRKEAAGDERQPKAENQVPSCSKRRGLSLRIKATTTAIAISVLPVLALGGMTYYVSERSSEQQANQAKQSGNPSAADIIYLTFLLKRQLQMGIAIGTGAVALLALAIALWLTNRSLRPVLGAAKTAAETAKLLRREAGETGSDLEFSGADELIALKTDLNLLAVQIPDLLKQQNAEGDRTQLLTDIALRVREAQDLDELLTIAVREVRQVLKSDRVLFFRLEPDGNGTIIAESVMPGFPKARGAKIFDPCFKERHIEMYRNGCVRAFDNIYKANLGECYIQLLEQFAVKASLIAPVLKDGQLLGLLIAHQCSAPRAWQQSEITFFSRLATQIGFALDRRLSAEQKAEAEAEERFMEITLRIRQSLKSADILTTTAQEIRKALRADRVLVYRFEPNWSGTVVAESVLSGLPKALGANIIDPCFKDRHVEQYRNGRVRATDNIYTANLSDCHIELLGRFGVRANLVAPILQGKELIGLLIAHQCFAPRTWKRSEIQLFTKLATQVGFALDQAAVLEEIEQARQELEGALRPRDRAIAAASFGLCIADATQPDYPIVYCNPAFEKMTGYSHSEAIGRNYRFLQGADTEPDAVAQIRRALHEQRECHVVLKNYRKDGSPFWNELTISPVQNEQGEVTHFIGLQTDITSRRQIASQVRAAAQAVTQTTQDNETTINTLSLEAALQVEKIAEAFNAIQAMASSVREVAFKARQAKRKMEDADRAVRAEDEAMRQTEVGMTGIRETLLKMVRKTEYLDEVSRKITQTMLSLNDFVSQINVLAMNVAVEVGRAGDDRESQELMAVAEAVRSLTEQSATATSEIEDLMTEIKTAINEIFAVMKQEAKQLNDETKWVAQSRQKLTQLVAINAQTSGLVEEIAQAAAAHAENFTSVSQLVREAATIADRTSEQSATVANSFAYLLKVAREMGTTAAQLDIE
ncbi:MAG: GAF domain-containing protein [Hydrococcus sp. C42_A2020_068]|nr:GAF domain-containing protein [Hydrococcus sp. C42_A2020_068]